MSKRTIDNLRYKENKVFRANIKKYKSINCKNVEENGIVSEQVHADKGDSGRTYCGKDAISLLSTVLTNQNLMMETLKNLETRMTAIEKSSNDIAIQRSEILAQNKVVRQCKVLIKRVHESLCRMTGETDDKNAIDIASFLPITNIDAYSEVEEGLKNLDFELAMKNYMWKLKGSSGTVDDVLRSLFADEFSYHFNIDGKFGKNSFYEITLINKTLFDVFQKEGQLNYFKGLRKYLELSHNRYRQRQHYESKNSKRLRHPPLRLSGTAPDPLNSD